MAMVADTLGPIGLVVGKFILSLLVIGLVMWWNLRRGVGVIATSILVLLLGANLGYHWSIRPQLSSFVCFAILIAILQFSFEGWRGNWHFRYPRTWFDHCTNESPNELGYESWKLRILWLVPFVFVVWTNSHGGFVAALSDYSDYMGMRALESLGRRGRRGWGLVRRMTLMAFVAVLASFLNPYGPNLHLWLLESLGSPRPEISDWATSELTSLVGMKLWLLVAVVVFAVAMTKRRFDATQLVLLSLTLWQSISHFRHVPFFTILAVYWIGPHLQSALERLKITTTGRDEMSAIVQKAVTAVLILGIAIVGFRLSQRVSELPVEKDVFPVDAIAFMQEHQIHGRIVVTYDWAQYVIGALCVEGRSQLVSKTKAEDSGMLRARNSQVSQVAFDGRFRTCYSQEVVDMHFDFLYGKTGKMKRFRSPNSPPCDPTNVLWYGEPDLVLISRHGEKTEQHMEQNQARWTLLFQDGLAQLWGLKKRFDDPQSIDYIPAEKRVIHDSMPTGFERWPAM